MYNNLILTVMMTVEKLSTIKSAGTYEYQGAVINVTEVTTNGRYKGTCILSSGKEFSFSNSAYGLKTRIANEGVYKSSKKVVIPCGHAEHSTCHGEHVTKVTSSNKRAKQHRKLMLALNDIQAVLSDSSDDIVNLIQSRWFEKAEAERRIEAEAEAKKAALAAKKQEEAEAKKQQELINTVVNDFNTLSKYMTEEQAVTVLSNKYGADVAQSVLFGMV